MLQHKCSLCEINALLQFIISIFDFGKWIVRLAVIYVMLREGHIKSATSDYNLMR